MRAGTPDGIGPKEEYQTLRQELLEAKRYVFERPLLIGGAGIAALTAFREVYAATVPLLVAGLLLFNFWFTVNRLQSAARIVAYVQLQLEERRLRQWIGWETSLRHYRAWLKRPEASAIVDRDIDQDAVPDALMYYPAIYLLHIGIALFATASSTILTLLAPTSLAIACWVGTLLAAGWFAPYAVRHRPEVMRTAIERNRVIWTHALTERPADPA